MGNQCLEFSNRIAFRVAAQFPQTWYTVMGENFPKHWPSESNICPEKHWTKQGEFCPISHKTRTVELYWKNGNMSRIGISYFLWGFAMSRPVVGQEIGIVTAYRIDYRNVIHIKSTVELTEEF